MPICSRSRKLPRRESDPFSQTQRRTFCCNSGVAKVIQGRACRVSSRSPHATSLALRLRKLFSDVTLIDRADEANPEVQLSLFSVRKYRLLKVCRACRLSPCLDIPHVGYSGTAIAACLSWAGKVRPPAVCSELARSSRTSRTRRTAGRLDCGFVSTASPARLADNRSPYGSAAGSAGYEGTCASFHSIETGGMRARRGCLALG